LAAGTGGGVPQYVLADRGEVAQCYRDVGRAGMVDRLSARRVQQAKTPPAVVRKMVRLRVQAAVGSGSDRCPARRACLDGVCSAGAVLVPCWCGVG
jgi:hypothetical protein